MTFPEVIFSTLRRRSHVTNRDTFQALSRGVMDVTELAVSGCGGGSSYLCTPPFFLSFFLPSLFLCLILETYNEHIVPCPFKMFTFEIVDLFLCMAMDISRTEKTVFALIWKENGIFH